MLKGSGHCELVIIFCEFINMSGIFHIKHRPHTKILISAALNIHMYKVNSIKIRFIYDRSCLSTINLIKEKEKKLNCHIQEDPHHNHQ